ncbi:MAG: thioredoxin [Lachnospiraceae bacterium]|nr:thioredoxin [Lachnospiraceae bacterium]MBQ4308089.1 thioredoxin [Lachnospiraceae bacterium]MBQ9464051.1 thioredoxin [Lachnospiraceae bacterium]MBR0106710.1 thioredoxin [Lachnospiraceae bacterium]MBR0402066.1 thioredoxin [Lachnospiraceae bacterium]
MIQVLNDANFDEVVMKAQQPVLVDFFATWCGPCKMLAPTLEQLEKEYEGKVIFGKYDIDQGSKAMEFMIQAVPTLKIFKGGEEVDEVVGVMPKAALAAKLDAQL